jgi:hypothetical protein
MSALVLHLPNFEQPFIVECDASVVQFSVVLHQGTGPVAYFCKPIAAHHAKLVAYERELMSLVHAMRHWRPYLWGHAFLIKTDHYNLKWASKLLGFDFHVEFIRGMMNVVANALSRHDIEKMAAMALSCPNIQLFDALRLELESSPELCALREEVAIGAKGEGWRV